MDPPGHTTNSSIHQLIRLLQAQPCSTPGRKSRITRRRGLTGIYIRSIDVFAEHSGNLRLGDSEKYSEQFALLILCPKLEFHNSTSATESEILRWEVFLCWKRRQLEFPPVGPPLGSYQLFHHNIELLEPLEKCLKFWSYVAEVTVFRKNSKFWAKFEVMCHWQKNSLTHKRIQNPKLCCLAAMPDIKRKKKNIIDITRDPSSHANLVEYLSIIISRARPTLFTSLIGALLTLMDGINRASPYFPPKSFKLH